VTVPRDAAPPLYPFPGFPLFPPPTIAACIILSFHCLDPFSRPSTTPMCHRSRPPPFIPPAFPRFLLAISLFFFFICADHSNLQNLPMHNVSPFALSPYCPLTFNLCTDPPSSNACPPPDTTQPAAIVILWCFSDILRVVPAVVIILFLRLFLLFPSFLPPFHFYPRIPGLSALVAHIFRNIYFLLFPQLPSTTQPHRSSFCPFSRAPGVFPPYICATLSLPSSHSFLPWIVGLFSVRIRRPTLPLCLLLPLACPVTSITPFTVLCSPRRNQNDQPAPRCRL